MKRLLGVVLALVAVGPFDAGAPVSAQPVTAGFDECLKAERSMSLPVAKSASRATSVSRPWVTAAKPSIRCSRGSPAS